MLSNKIPARKRFVPKRKAARIVTEALESRTLLSATLSGTTLNVTGTSGPDTFTLSDNGMAITVVQGASTFTFADSSVSKIVVNPSAGGDTVNLQSNTKPATITGGGLDTVNIGNTGSLQQIAAAVSVSNPGSFTNLTLDGSADSGTTTATLTSSSITGMSPAAITYTASQLSGLALDTGYPLTVTGTGVLHGGASTVLGFRNESLPINNVTVLATTGPLYIASGQQVTIGTGNVQAIHGAVDDDCSNPTPGDGTALTVDDSTDATGRNVVISGQDPLVMTGISPASITFDHAVADCQFVVNAGNGNDTIVAGGAVFGDGGNGDTINAGGGNDTIIIPPSYVGPTTMQINGQAGNDTVRMQNVFTNSFIGYVDGGTGFNINAIDGSLFSQPESLVVIGDGTLATGSGQEYLYGTNIQEVQAFGGSGDDIISTSESLTLPLVIHGGAGNDSITGGRGDANETLYGDAGNDTITAEFGNESLNGGPGNDVLTGGWAIDTLDGGDGQPIQIIADNFAASPSTAGGQGVTVTGNWIISNSDPGYYGINYYHDNNSHKGEKTIQCTPTIPTTGSYQVYARWTADTNRSNHVPFIVNHQGTSSRVYENQQINNNAWVLLGTYSLNAGTGSSVTVSNAGTTGYVVADAVRFVPAVATASISGIVFNDANGNGVQDAAEGGVAGRVVYIDSNKDGILDNGEPSTTTDAAGYWQFTGLAAGTYRIREQNVAGVRHTDPPGGANYYDATVVTGPTASAIYGTRFGEQEMTAASAPVLAINAGGPTFVLNSGFTYTADTGFTGGTATTTPFEVAGTDNDPIYYSYRSGTSFSYSLAVPNGTYSLVLNFVDPTKTAAGQRKFNVTVEGKQVLTNFDIVAAAGPKSAVSKAFTVTVTGGKLTLSLTSVVGSAILSGIVLYPS